MKKTLLALVDAPDHVCSRYRLRPFVPQLESRGWQVRIVGIPAKLAARRRLFRQAASADVVFLQRKLLDRFQMRFLRRHARRLIFDFDDAIFQRDSFSSKNAASRRRIRRFRRTVASSDLVLAGNEFLAAKAAEHAIADRVAVVPTCVDPAPYPARPFRAEEPRGELELVWIGSASTIQYLERSRAIWEAIGEQLPGVRLKVICDAFPDFHRLPVREVEWTADSELRELTSADVGVAYLTDDDWSRGKCGLKVLQYMAAALPVVVNSVGEHPRMVAVGASGFLADSSVEWIEAIGRFASDRSLARSMGERGRAILEERYSVSRWTDRFADLIEG